MPDDLRQTLTRSAELSRAGRHEEHLALVRDALARHRGEPEVVTRAAEAHVVEDREEAANLAWEAVELAPDDPGTLTRAAFVMFHVERLEDARKLFSRAKEAADEDFELTFDLAHLGGQLALAHGDQAKAEELFELAFESHPDTAGYGLALAGLLADRGDHQRALDVTEAALRHRPGDSLLEDMRLRLQLAVHGWTPCRQGSRSTRSRSRTGKTTAERRGLRRPAAGRKGRALRRGRAGPRGGGPARCGCARLETAVPIRRSSARCRPPSSLCSNS